MKRVFAFLYVLCVLALAMPTQYYKMYRHLPHDYCHIHGHDHPKHDVAGTSPAIVLINASLPCLSIPIIVEESTTIDPTYLALISEFHPPTLLRPPDHSSQQA